MAEPHDVTPDDFRSALSHWASGVTVVTAEGPAGMTVSAFSSLSLDPPLITVALAQSAYAHDPLVAADGFVVHILGDDESDVSTRFASPGDRFGGIGWDVGRYNAPVLHAGIARLSCRRHAILEGGDHSILVGRVEQVDVNHGDPVLYYRGAYRTLEPREDAN